MQLGRIPHRAITALIIATCGLTAALATGMVNEVHGLPAAFVPAPPVPGESVEYQFVRVDPEGEVVAGPLPAFRQTSLGNHWALDTRGEAVLVHVVDRQEGSYVKQGTDFASYNPKDDVTQLPWSWGQTVAEAVDGDGGMVWYSGGNGQVTVRDSAMLVLPAEHRRDESVRYTNFGDRNGRLFSSCLATPLPENVPLDRPFMAGDRLRGGFCHLMSPWLDERHPDRTTGMALHERPDAVGGMGLELNLEAVGSVKTDFGEGVMFRHAPQESSWEVRFVYVPEIPYPVWVSVATEDSPTRDIIFLHSYETPADEPAVPGSKPPQAPRLAWTELRPWGMDDAGMDLPILPSRAWAAALAPATDGTASPLAKFLARHDGAFTESAEGSLEYAMDDTFGVQERFRWQFQVRGGDERIHVVIRESSTPLALLGELSPLEVEYTDPVQPRWSLDEAPRSLPTMRSVAAQFDHWTGLGQPTEWQLTPACNKRVAVECGPELLGLAVNAGAAQQHEEPALDAESLALRMDQWNTGSHMSWLVDGRVQSMATYTIAAQTTTHPMPSGDAAPPAVAAAAPATDYVRAAGYTLGAAAFLAAILYYLWPALKAVPTPLFSRVRDSQLLEHPARAKLARAIEEEPGIHHQKLVRLLGSGQGTADHHLQKLVAARAITRAATGGYTCYFPIHTDRRVMAAAPALRSPTSRQVLASTVGEPVTAADIARAAGIARSSTAHHLARLMAAQVVEQCGGGRQVRYRATALGRQMAQD